MVSARAYTWSVVRRPASPMLCASEGMPYT